MTNFRNDSVCGLYCGACPILTVTRYRETGAATGARLKGDFEKERCHGCRSDDVSDWCADCNIKACATEKNLSFCFECDEFPCESLHQMEEDQAPHHTGIIRNQRCMKESGPESWLASQEKRWSCPQCGLAFTWYESKCSNCGTALKNCIHELMEGESSRSSHE